MLQVQFNEWSRLGMALALVMAGAGCLETDESDEAGEMQAALGPEDECLPADVTWPNPGSTTDACAGPWTYNAYPTTMSRDPLCDIEGCDRRQVCDEWRPQTPKKPTTQHTRDGINCHLVPGQGLVCDPDVAGAQAFCNGFKNAERDKVEAPADQRVTDATVTTDLLTQPGPNVLEHTFKCTATIQYEKRFTGRWDSCSCEIIRYESCEHATGTPQRRVSLAGLSLTQVRELHDESIPGQYSDNQIGARCTTGEDVPATSLQTKLNRLLNGLADPQIVTPSSPFFGEFVRRAKITYELFSNADLASFARRPEILALYRDRQTLEPTCGRNKPPTDEGCNGDWQLRLCTRLTSMHVKVSSTHGDLIRDLYPECIDQLRQLADEIESSACTAEGDFAEWTLEAQRGVQDKLMLRLGTKMDRGATATNTALLAATLHLIDRWYPEAARTLVEGDRVKSELELVSNKFWQVVYGYRMAAGGAEWTTNSPYAYLQASLNAAEEETDPAKAIDILRDALSDTDTRGLKLDRDVLTAIYANVDGAPAMTGGPLLHFTADALVPMVQRLDSLVEFHDVGCSFAECANFTVPTKLSRFWRVLAHLDAAPGASPSLAEVLSAVPDEMLGWKATFTSVRNAQQRLLAALDGVGSPEDAREDALLALLDKARARSDAYESTGLFLPPVGNRLYTAVHADQRADVRQHILRIQSQITSAKAELEDDLLELVNGLVRVQEADTATAQLEAAQERLALERDDLARRDAALRALIDGAQGPNAVLEQLMAEWARVDEALDEGAYIRLGEDDTIHLSLSARDAGFEGWTGHSIADVGVQKIAVPAGRSISVATDGEWGPSCALRAVSVIDPSADEGAPGQAIDPTNVWTGPEGYSIAWTGSRFEAKSQSDTRSERLTVGGRIEQCAGIPLLGSETRGCGYVDRSVTWQDETSSQHGTEQRTSAQFSGGLYVPITPFNAPAGALVIAEMPPGETDPALMRDLHLVHRPHTTIVVDQAADLWVVVNDIFCEEQDDLNRLGVTIGVFTPVGEAAEALLPRIAYTLSRVRARMPGMVARGEIFPSEMSEIERQAKLDAIESGPQIPVDEYPLPLRDLFYKFLAREMTRLEASVRLVGVEREIAIRDAEYLANRRALRNTQLSGYLLALSPEWAARDLDFKQLRDLTATLARDLRYYLGPMLQLWYPGLVSAMQGQDDLDYLVGIDLDTPIAEMADRISGFVGWLDQALESASLPYPDPDETAPMFVALRFPKPSALDPACADSPSSRCRAAGQSTTFRWATVAQTRELWKALGEPGEGGTRTLSFNLSPDDLYDSTGTAYLSCTKSLPIVRKMGLALTGFGTEELPNEPRSTDGENPPVSLMAFPDATGTRLFQRESAVWDWLANVPLVYGTFDYNAIRDAFNAEPEDLRGMSPFTTFTFNFSASEIEEWKFRQARTIDVLFQLEGTRGAERVATPACSE